MSQRQKAGDFATQHQTGGSNVQQSSSGGGIGFTGALAIVFIILKLTGHIAWSWWWVLSPLWIPLAIVLGVGLIVLVVAGIAAAFKN